MNNEHLRRRLPALLSAAAERVPADSDLRASIHRRLARSVVADERPASPRRGRPHLGERPSRRRGPLAAALIAALVVLSAFAVASPLVLSWLGDSSLKAAALRGGVVIDRSVTAQGVTLRLGEGYADAARTALTLRISGGDKAHPPTPYMPSLRVEDAAGRTYRAITGFQLNSDALFEFLPFPADALGSVQSLTLVLGEMQHTTGDPTNPMTTFAGPWRVAFQLRPQAGKSFALAVPAQMHGGVTLRPERLDLAPAGVRLMVRVSGLPADTSLFSLVHFMTHESEIIACPPGQHICGGSSGGITDGARMLLTSPDGQTMPPAWVSVTSPPPNDDISLARQMVGPGGEAQLEFLFFAPLRSTHGSVHVTFDEVRFAPATDPTADERAVSGPWVFDLPLS